jgi:hypothetical protein
MTDDVPPPLICAQDKEVPQPEVIGVHDMPAVENLGIANHVTSWNESDSAMVVDSPSQAPQEMSMSAGHEVVNDPVTVGETLPHAASDDLDEDEDDDEEEEDGQGEGDQAKDGIVMDGAAEAQDSAPGPADVDQDDADADQEDEVKFGFDFAYA